MKDKISLEVKNFELIDNISNFTTAYKQCTDKKGDPEPFYYITNNKDELDDICKNSLYQTYSIDDKVVFVVNNGTEEKYNRLKNSKGEYVIKDIYI